MSPRHVPATVAELARVGLFAELTGEALRGLAARIERREAAAGARIECGHDSVVVLLSGLARNSKGLVRPGELAEGFITAMIPCVGVVCERAILDAVLGRTA